MPARYLAPLIVAVLGAATPALGSTFQGVTRAPGSSTIRPTTAMGVAADGFAAAGSTLPGPARRGPSSTQRPDLRELSLEELAAVEITSVSKQPEARFTAASAVHLLTGEEIRRSGARSIPEALRLVPGLHVARVTANTWAIAARGFNGRFANKLLVLVDGRAVYTPLFSGVYWETAALPLDLVERIEVILGPGGSIWGANAVTGVINIMTRAARDTQGVRNEIGTGTEHRFFETFRYGGRLGDTGHYRVHGRFRGFDESIRLDGRGGHDDLRLGNGGFRIDWGEQDAWTLLGNVYAGRAGQTTLHPTLAPPFTRRISPDTELSGGDATLRWNGSLSGRSETRLQAYYDRYDRVERRGAPQAEFDQTVQTFDVELRHSWRPGRHEVVFGGNVRAVNFDTVGSFAFSLDDPEPTDALASVFVQDRVSLLDERLLLTLGTKVETNTLTGPDFLPTIRAAWSPTPRHALWGAVSRAVRVPSRSEYDGIINAAVFPVRPGSLGLIRLLGNERLDPEQLIAAEAGYRAQPHSRISIDVATFYDDYADLLLLVQREPRFEVDPVPHLLFPSVFENAMEGTAYGGEVVATADASSRIRLNLSYSYLRLDLAPDAGIDPAEAITDEGKDPTHQAKIQAFIDLPAGLRVDTSAQYADALEGIGVPPHTRLDVVLGWKLGRGLELSLVGQDLLEDDHLEFRDVAGGNPDALFQRSVYAALVWRPASPDSGR